MIDKHCPRCGFLPPRIAVPTDRKVWRHQSVGSGKLPKQMAHQIGRIRNPEMALSEATGGLILNFEVVNQDGGVSYWMFDPKEAEPLLIDARVRRVDQLAGLIVDLFKRDALTVGGFSFSQTLN